MVILSFCHRSPSTIILVFAFLSLGFPGGSASKESACNAGDLGLIPGLERSLGKGKGYPLQYCVLENSMDCVVHRVAKSREDSQGKKMATHSSTLAWKIPWMEETGRLQSMGSESQTRLSNFPGSLIFLSLLSASSLPPRTWFSYYNVYTVEKLTHFPPQVGLRELRLPKLILHYYCFFFFVSLLPLSLTQRLMLSGLDYGEDKEMGEGGREVLSRLVSKESWIQLRLVCKI